MPKARKIVSLLSFRNETKVCVRAICSGRRTETGECLLSLLGIQYEVFAQLAM